MENLSGEKVFCKKTEYTVIEAANAFRVAGLGGVSLLRLGGSGGFAVGALRPPIPSAQSAPGILSPYYI